MHSRSSQFRSFAQPLAILAVALLLAPVGCTAPQPGRYGNALAHLLGVDACGCASSCGCGDCVVETGTVCAANCGDPVVCGDEGPADCHADCNDGCGQIDVCGPVCAVAQLPCTTVASVATCCTPHACPGPPDVPPPGRFHPVPTRPVFSPRFAPAPYGVAEF